MSGDFHAIVLKRFFFFKNELRRKGKLKFLCKVGGLPFLNGLWFVLKIRLMHALPSEYPAHIK